jgi:hypothetical protein
MRAVAPQLIGALATAAAGWLLQMTVSSHWPSLLRIVSSAAACTAIYLVIVVGLFGLREPIRVARSVVEVRLISKVRGS